MDLLEEGNLLLQTLNASLQVQPGQSGIVNILDENKDRTHYSHYQQMRSNGKLADEQKEWGYCVWIE